MMLATPMRDVKLRAWASTDRLDLVKHGNNRKVWRNLTDVFPSPYTLDDADAWIARAGSTSAQLHLAIEFGGEAVGGIGVVARDGNHRLTGRFGYWLGEACWGRGIATAAALAMSRHVLATRELVRLEAPVFAWNPASARVLEKVGFTLEGVHRRSMCKDGVVIDTLMYALIRE
jgi:ribosomal-protein-alanine N-acetyltransferase